MLPCENRLLAHLESADDQLRPALARQRSRTRTEWLGSEHAKASGAAPQRSEKKQLR